MELKHWLVFIGLAMFFFTGMFGLITDVVIAWVLLIGFFTISLTNILTSAKFNNWRTDRK